MVRGRKRLSKAITSKATVKKKNEMKQYLLNKICGADLLAESNMKNGKKKYGSVAKVVNDMKGDFPWLSRDVINYALKVYKKQQQSNAVSDATVADPIDDSNGPPWI